MSLNGLDYSMGLPSIAAMKQGNVAFVCRYVGWSDTSQAKILTPAEAQLLNQNDIALVSNYEWYSTRPQEGAAAAAVDAARALQIHTSCGGPVDAPIYFSVDYNSPGSDVAAYFKALASILGIQRVGAYGGYDCIKYLFDNGLITYGWQTYAWSNGRWDNRAHIRQTQNSIQFAGIEVDVDMGMFAQIGQWNSGASKGPAVALVKNNAGMVLDLPWSNQLTSGEPGNMCTVWAIAVATFAGLPGKGPRASGAGQENPIDDLAELWWLTHNDGMPASVEWALTQSLDPTGGQRNLHYCEYDPTVANMQALSNAGYVFGFTAWEGNILDKHNGGRQAYGWVVGNHFLLGAGLDADGDLICADQLIGWQGYWPPVYQINDLHSTYLVAIQVVGPDPNHPWQAPFPTGQPSTWPSTFNCQLFAGALTMGIPTGWKPGPNNTIIAPNGQSVAMGFMNAVENSTWNPADVPQASEMARPFVELGNKALGPGSIQCFRQTVLGYTKDRGVYQVYQGQELQATINALTDMTAQRDALTAKVTILEAALAAASNTGLTDQVKTDIKALSNLGAQAVTLISQLEKDAGI